MPVPVIMDCSLSPYSWLKPVPIDSVKFLHGYWADYLETITQITLPTQYDLLETTGRLDNFRRISSDIGKPFRGYFFNDSDVYKWLEAACWSLALDQNELIQSQVGEVIRIISAAQDSDGYLDTYFCGDKKKDRWTNLGDMHELYCAGHLIQAAITHHRVTGQEELLTVAVRFADHISNRFLDSSIPGTPGHPEIEMALVELYRTTRDARYIRLAQSLLDQRGNGLIGGRDYHLDHIPFRELNQLVGHAVRAMYLCCGATDIYLETGENVLLGSLERLWHHMVSRQMYITGGIGSRHQGESFGGDYELPNERAYAETCAAIGSVMWNWRMLHSMSINSKNSSSSNPDVKYADLIEWTLYNAVLPGIGLNGREYHYVNPLEVYNTHERQPWFECACCPTNVVRMIASAGGYFYSHSKDKIWIHQYAASLVDIILNNEIRIKFHLETDYPKSGKIEIRILSVSKDTSHSEENKELTATASFGINLRIPSWLQGNIPIRVNDVLWNEPGIPGGYLSIIKEWRAGDKIKFEIPLTIRFLESHPYVQENSGRVVLCKGPLLYCIEENDNAHIDPRDVYLNPQEDFSEQPIRIQSWSVEGIQLNAHIRKTAPQWIDCLYKDEASLASDENENKRQVMAIPYFAWGNRAKGWMQVWINRKSGIKKE